MSDFPKMPCAKVGNRLVNLIYKSGHPLAGRYVIFEDAAAEKAFKQSDAEPEKIVARQHPENHLWRHARERVTGGDVLSHARERVTP